MELPNISLFGGMGAGKSTAAKYFAEAHGYSHIPMANGLKDAAERLWGPDARVSRDKLQKLGKYVREIEPDTLLDSFADEYYEFVERTGLEVPVVTDDMRYANEFWGLKRMGFVFIRVEAPEAQRVDRLILNGKLDDVSQLQDETETQTQLVGAAAEAQGIKADFTVHNDTDNGALYTQLETVLAKIEEGQ
jgi:dephospho-CoA kinase